MQFLLHAPSRLDVFITPNRHIARFLHHNHKWAVIKTERDEVPEYISTSSIWERDDGTVTIDEVVLDDGRHIVQQMKGYLRRDGFRDPDLGYVGRLVIQGKDEEVV